MSTFINNKKPILRMTSLDEAYDYTVVDCFGNKWSKKRTLDAHTRCFEVFHPISLLAIPSYLIFKYIVFVNAQPTYTPYYPDYSVTIDVNKL